MLLPPTLSSNGNKSPILASNRAAGGGTNFHLKKRSSNNKVAILINGIMPYPSVLDSWKIKFEKSSLTNWTEFSKLIFAGYTGSKNQVRTRKKIKFDSKSIFFKICNKLPNWHFKNQAQIDTVSVFKKYLEATKFQWI